jgi:hypothetical protein
MANIFWTGGSGSWGDAADWTDNSGVNRVPGAGDQVQISVAGITVSIDSAEGTITSLFTSLSTLGVTTGGTLFIEQQTFLNGAYAQSGGELILGGSGGTFNSQVNQSGGMIDVLSGDLLLTGQNDSLAGTIAGAGTLAITGGTTTLNTGIVLSIGTVEAAGGTLQFGANLAIKSNFVSNSNGQLALDGHKVQIEDSSYLGGIIGGSGTLVMNGGGVVSNLSLDGAMALDINGAVTETAGINAGGNQGATALLAIGKTGALRIAGDFGIGDNSGSGRIKNEGLLTKIGGSETSAIQGALNSSGTIAVASGTIQLDGPINTVSGVVSGNGALQFAGGTTTLGSKLTLSIGTMSLAQGATLIENKSLAFANEWDQTSGVFWLASAKTTLSLSGIANLDGGLIKGAGTLDISGTGNIARTDIEGVVRLNLTGQLDQTGNINIGNDFGTTPVVTIAAGAGWLIENDSSIGGSLGEIFNKGTLSKSNGSGTSTIDNLLINTGTLTSNNSTLALAGGASLGGTVNGTGLLDLTNSGTYVLANGLALSTAALSIDDTNGGTVTLGGNLSYANIFTEHTGTLSLGGYALALTGTAGFDGGVIAGSGTLASAGATTLSGVAIIENAAVSVTGAAEQVGNIFVGDNGFGGNTHSAATLNIAKGATYTLDDNGSIFNNGTLSVAGTLVTSAAGTSEIDTSVVDNGLIQAGSGEMLFLGNITGTGTLGMGASTVLDFRAGATIAGTDKVSFGGAGGDLVLENPGNFAATLAGFSAGDLIEVAGLNFSTLNAPVIAGKTVTLSDNSGDASVTLTFSTAQTLSSLGLEIGPHGYVALTHS